VRLIAWLAVFFISFVVCMIICTILWQNCITDKLYNCTDPAWLDFLFPGNWVHGEIVYLPKIPAHRSMSEPDAIKAGWSLAGLWLLWLAFVIASFGVSALLGRICSARFRIARVDTGHPAVDLPWRRS